MTQKKKKSKFDRLTWMKIHGYMSCFFLPIAFMYVITGTLYMFEIRGNKIPTTYNNITEATLPTTQADAEKIAKSFLTEKNLPSDYNVYEIDNGHHYWTGLKHRYELGYNDNGVFLTHTKHDLWYQFMYIHKGHGGPLFTIFGIALGTSLFISLLSGGIIILKTVPLRRQAYKFAGVGLALLTIVYFIS